jgi:chemotaxis protein methyltransferase CheR
VKRVGPDEFGGFFAQIAARLGLRAAGYRRTRGSVERRVRRRIRALALGGLDDYRAYLDQNAQEWSWLDACCRITISRFWRDADVFDRLAAVSLPDRAAAARARGQPGLRLWSAGCASGEEAFSLALAALEAVRPRFPDLRVEVLATDADPVVLARAGRAAYAEGTLRELPRRLHERAFERRGHEYHVRPELRAGVRFDLLDLRGELPAGPFDLICCRNLFLTYFEPSLASRLARSFGDRLLPGGILVVGVGETLPLGSFGLVPVEPCIYTRVADASAGA